MSRDSVEAAKRIFEEWWSISTDDDDEFRRFAERAWDPGIEYHEDPKWPGSSTYRGRDEVFRAWLEYLEVLGRDIEGELVDVREGEGVVLALVRSPAGRGRSRCPWTTSGGYHCHVRNGRLLRLRAYFDSDEALGDAGL